MARTLSLAAACSAAALILAPAAGAHGGSSSRGLTEAQLRRAETSMLGAQHAAEHAVERHAERRQARRLARMSPARRRAVLRRLARPPRAHTAVDPPPASEVGAWNTDPALLDAPFKLPDYAITAALLATGKVLIWGYPYDNKGVGTGPTNRGTAWLWDPSKGYGPDAFDEKPPPLMTPPGESVPRVAAIFCSGQSFTPNGTLLVAGGNYEIHAEQGLKTLFTFDPFTEKWHRQADGLRGRWYPSQVLLPNGRTLLVGGYTQTGTTDTNTDLEIWPARDEPVPGNDHRDIENVAPEVIPSGDHFTTVYPRLQVTNGNRVALTGPGYEDRARLDIDTFTWSDIPHWPGVDSHRVGLNAVLEPAGPDGLQEIMLIGGYTFPSPTSDGKLPATKETLTIKPDAASPTWSAGPPQSVARSYSNTVQLPDGSLVTVGGGYGADESSGGDGGYYTNGDDPRLRGVELFNPVTRQWSVGAAQTNFRAYHSTAILLPDGRVLSAGDDDHEDDYRGTDTAMIGNAEIYSPPYLFRGARPAITGAPASIAWGKAFTVTADPGQPLPAKAVLVAPGATTHAADMSQRYVPLVIGSGSGTPTLTVQAPPDGAAAPPGYYMLFLLDADGVPSKAQFVQLGPVPPDPAAVPSQPEPAGGDQPQDGQPPADSSTTPLVVAKPKATMLRVSVRTTALRSLLRTKHLTVRLTSPRAVKLRVAVDRGSHQLAGPRTITFTKAGTRTVKIALSARARRDLRAGSRRIKIVVRFPAGQKWTVTGTSALLR